MKYCISYVLNMYTCCIYESYTIIPEFLISLYTETQINKGEMIKTANRKIKAALKVAICPPIFEKSCS